MKPLYVLVQCTWGMLQTILGLCVYLFHRNDPHFHYHGAIVTQWEHPSSVSLGLFVFVTSKPYFAKKFESTIPLSELSRGLLVHEYGHTIQSLILGPLYLIAIGIPSTLWGFSPQLARKRKAQQQSYFSFFTERWANALGKFITKEISLGQLVID